MTAEQAKANQNRIAKHFNLGWWYGTRCKKCCGVYPKLMTTDRLDHKCYYQCEVCGKRTKEHEMPLVAEEAWNNGKYKENEYRQYSLF